MPLTSLRRAVGAAVLFAAGGLMLAGCSADSDQLANTVAGQLPDLSSQGFVAFSCGDGDAIGGSFQQPQDPYVAQCWEGSPSTSFVDVANSVADAVALATGGTNVTADVCPDDALSAAGGIACRAALVTEGDDSVLVRTVVVLADPAAVLSGLPSEPTQDEIDAALAGADVEVLVGTQSPTEAGVSEDPSPS